MPWINLNTVSRQLTSAGVAAGIAAASEVFARTKQELISAAPAGRSTSPDDPLGQVLGLTRVRPGGRTRRSITLGAARVTAQRGLVTGSATLEAEPVMAAQGFYQDAGSNRRRIGNVNVRATNRGWITRAVNRGRNRGVIRIARAAFARQFTAGGAISINRANVSDTGFTRRGGRSDYFGESGRRYTDAGFRERLYRRSLRALPVWRSQIARAFAALR